MALYFLWAPNDSYALEDLINFLPFCQCDLKLQGCDYNYLTFLFTCKIDGPISLQSEGCLDNINH